MKAEENNEKQQTERSLLCHFSGAERKLPANKWELENTHGGHR